MAPRKNPQPSEFELQVLGVLWEHGPQTVRQVMDRLTDGKSRAYTSVLSVMQVMQKKGLLAVGKQRDGLAHVFRPKVTRRQVVTPLLRGLVTRVFGGKTSVAVQQLLDTETIDREEIDALRELLDSLEARQANGK
ncbi:MAG: BlaI/MecI/CopY family transcriptional regulator [Thermoguttaceae bacterium]